MGVKQGRSGRHGKIVAGRHSTRVQGLDKFCKELEKWPEITSIRLGSLATRNRVGRKSSRLKTDPSQESGLAVVKGHKRAIGGGGFSFRATRPAVVGNTVTGIKCDASYGTVCQEVVLSGPDLEALKLRLQKENLGGKW